MDFSGTLLALGGGILSFASPCVLPLIPIYVSIVSGASMEELRRGETEGLMRRVALGSLAFILGFTVIFVALGATATAVGVVLRTHLPVLTRIGGIVIIILGLHLTGIFRIPGLQVERRMDNEGAISRTVGPLRAFIVGLTFAFGWTPCIGPVLAGILAYAGNQDTVGKGIYLLVVYSLGLGIPFFVAAMGINKFLSVSKKLRNHFKTIEVCSGVIVILMGTLMVTNKLTALVTWAQRLGWRA